MANEFDSNFTFLLKKEKKHGIGGIVINFVSNDFWYISDKNGSEFYNMFTSKAEAEEECLRRGGGYVGQLYKVNFGIEDTLGFADKIIGGLYEILYDCVGVQAERWCAKHYWSCFE